MFEDGIRQNIDNIIFYFRATRKYDNTRSLRIKQSDGKYVRFGYAETSFNLLEESVKLFL